MKKLLQFFALIVLWSNFSGQTKDSLQINNERYIFKPSHLYVPAGLMVGGLLTEVGKNSIEKKIAEQRNEHLPNFNNHLDDYLQFAPFAAAYAFELGGMKPRTDWKNRTAIMAKGTAINLGMVYALKKITNKTRPDGSKYSFPSGHTANAFAGATLVSMEYGKDYKWVPYAAYGVAATVGAMRIANNRHYISDVLFGAGLGILSMKTAYWTHQYKWNRTSSDVNALNALYQPTIMAE